LEVLNRGQVAAAAEVNIETLRYYERRGLIPAPPRSPANYRRYPQHTVHRVRFVRHAQDLGFSLDEIKQLFSLKATRGAKSADVKRRATTKIGEINERIRHSNASERLWSVSCRNVPGMGQSRSAQFCTRSKPAVSTA